MPRSPDTLWSPHMARWCQMSGIVYIIEFTPPIHHARYYVGYCAASRLSERFAEHLAGRGARLTQVAAERGVKMAIVLTMPGTRETERQIKRSKNTPRLVAQARQKGGSV